MNDLANCVENADITMYADDTSASTTIKSVSDVEYKLTPDMVKICDWLKSNKLSLNALKTEFMIIGTNRNVHNTTDLIAVHVDGALIRRVNKLRCLGLIVDDRPSWKEHISYISSKVSRNIGILKRVRECVTKETLLIMYRTLIEPCFRYCNTTWGNCGTTLLKKLQTFQNRVARVIEGVKYDEADHPKILRNLNILNVHQLVMLDNAFLVYKINNDLTPQHTKDWFTKCSTVHSYSTRAAVAENFGIPKVKTEKAKQSFLHSGAKIWNELPDHVKRSQHIT